MKLFKNTINHVRHISGSKLLLATLFVVFSAALLGFGAYSQSIRAGAASGPRDCDGNAIIKCGFGSASDFASSYRANKTGDLPAIYAHYGLSSSELGRFQSTAKAGVVYKDGRVTVGGKVVATGARSLGRHYMNGSSTVTIGGDKYYERSTSVSFGSNSLTAQVMMNSKNEPEFVVLNACGNPIKFTPKPQQSAECTMLNKEATSKPNTFNFSSTATVKNGAKVTKVVYDFGDGSATVTKTNPAEKVSHTYKPGKFTAKVTVYAEVDGKIVTRTSASCTKPVEVKETPKPEQSVACEALVPTKITRTKFGFAVKAKTTNGATLTNGSFDFGDGQTAQNIKPTIPNLITVTHEYKEAKDYTITATLNFSTDKGVKSDKCETKITVTPETCETNPNLPECEPCKVNPNLPQCQPCAINPEAPECKPTPPTPPTTPPETPETPSELPSTGPAEILGSTVGLGSIVTAGGYYIRSRRDLLSAIFKR